MLLRLEAYALLVGAITSFAAIAATMYLTRNIDWYGSDLPGSGFAAAAAATGPESRSSWLD